MRRLVASFAAIVALAAGVALTQGAELRLPGLDQGELTEGQLAQGTHIVVFWTSWAPRGRDVVDRVNRLVDRWGDRARVVTVNFQEDERAVRSFLSDKPDLKARVFLDEDGELSKRHHVNSAPWLLILKDGRTSFSEKLPRDPDTVVAQVLGS